MFLCYPYLKALTNGSSGLFASAFARKQWGIIMDDMAQGMFDDVDFHFDTETGK
jgi:hypothetical protein